MGIGKRKFLEFTSAFLVGLTIDPLKAITINGDNYINKKPGIILTKPKNWDFVSIKDFGKLKKDQVLSDEFEPTKEDVWQELGEPVLVIAKYGLDKPEFHDKFSPAINVFINHKNDIIDIYEDEEINGDFEKIVDMIVFGSARLIKDYATTRSIRPYQLSECNGFDSEWTWTFESIEHKKSWHCKTWSIIIENGDYIYSFNLIESEQAGKIERQNFQEFVSSIRIA